MSFRKIYNNIIKTIDICFTVGYYYNRKEVQICQR